MKIIERLYEYLSFKGIKPTAFEKQIGISNGYLGKQFQRKADIGESILIQIIENCPDLNILWFLREEGEMLIGEKVKLPEKIALKTEDKTGLPLVSIHAVAGFGNANFAISDRDVKDYYIIPKFKYLKVDFMIEVSGSSMYPKYSSGDIIACTIIRESKFIQWNKCHVVATKEQGILVKRLKKGDTSDTILAISDNKDYDPFLIPINEITGIALVVGVIRLE